jgi:hypothetical protein
MERPTATQANRSYRRHDTLEAAAPRETFNRYVVDRGPDTALTMQSERTGIENKWYALKGRVVELKVEADGDLHIALHDATGDKPGVVVCEVPATTNRGRSIWSSTCVCSDGAILASRTKSVRRYASGNSGSKSLNTLRSIHRVWRVFRSHEYSPESPAVLTIP